VWKNLEMSGCQGKSGLTLGLWFSTLFSKFLWATLYTCFKDFAA